jgi:hypothetical protein
MRHILLLLMTCTISCVAQSSDSPEDYAKECSNTYYTLCDKKIEIYPLIENLKHYPNGRTMGKLTTVAERDSLDELTKEDSTLTKSYLTLCNNMYRYWNNCSPHNKNVFDVTCANFFDTAAHHYAYAGRLTGNSYYLPFPNPNKEGRLLINPRTR